MSEYLEKIEYLKDKALLEKDIKKERHDFIQDRVQPYFNKFEDDISANDKQIALIKQSQNTMTEKMNEGFARLEKKMEAILKWMKDTETTKTMVEGNSKRIKSLENWVWWAIWLVATWIVLAILKLILK